MNSSVKKLSVESAAAAAEIISIALMDKDFPYQEKTNLAYAKIYNEEYFTKFLAKERRAAFGAYQDEKLVGIITLTAEQGGVMHIDWLVIKKEFRGKGWGTLLIKEAEKWALENELHYAYLFTEADKNIGFYETNGFEFVGKHLNSWFGEKENMMGKSLRDKPFDSAWTK
jgi:GNAT superfamily N-acetyltransferase